MLFSYSCHIMDVFFEWGKSAGEGAFFRFLFTFGPVGSNKNIANKNNHQTAKAISLF